VFGKNFEQKKSLPAVANRDIFYLTILHRHSFGH
jgi:hypothetical protein